jgi:hypothetical protein
VHWRELSRILSRRYVRTTKGHAPEVCAANVYDCLNPLFGAFVVFCTFMGRCAHGRRMLFGYRGVNPPSRRAALE